MGGSRLVGWLVAAVLGGSVGLTVDAAAKAKRPRLVAKVNGKRFKANLPNSVHAEVTSGGVLITGASHHGLRNGSTKSLNVVCGTISLATASLPVTVDCGGTYSVATNKGFSVTTKGWAGDTGLQVTFTSFDGSTTTGTFQGGNWPAGETNPGDPPAVLSHGKFVAPVIP